MIDEPEDFDFDDDDDYEIDTIEGRITSVDTMGMHGPETTQLYVMIEGPSDVVIPLSPAEAEELIRNIQHSLKVIRGEVEGNLKPSGGAA